MYNLKLNDPACAAVMLDEMLRFKSFGGGTIVENTTHGIDRSLKFMKDLSERSGVNIIAGTGEKLCLRSVISVSAGGCYL